MNRSHILRLSIALLFVSSFIACKKHQVNKAEPNIYIAGVSGDTAIYWKNGAPTLLSNGIGHAEANQVALAGNTVYISGDDLNGVDNGAVLWNQSRPLFLPVHSGTISSMARSVFVSGADVYTAGWVIGSNNVLYTTWWKNITATVIDSTRSGDPHSIAVANGSVYICGTSQLNGVTTATWWKDGAMHTLTTGEESYAHSIAISGSDVYIAGTHAVAPVDLPALWKNGQLTNFSNNNGVANSVVVSGGDVYVGGYEVIGGVYTATLWKNGVAQHMPGGAQSSVGSSVSVNGNDVYLAGFVQNNNVQQACYWKNGQLFKIGNPGSNAISIVVQ